jgi:drug/metabolite transporter (DMT)-like permease
MPPALALPSPLVTARPGGVRGWLADLGGAGPIAAYLTICFVWGSTFLAIRVAVETLPPWSLIAVRSLLAGLVLSAIALWRGATLPTRGAAWACAALSGVLLFTCSQAMLAWGETRLPSGIAAVLGCTVSLFTPIASWSVGASRRPTGLASLGLLAGFAGTAILVRPNGQSADGFACLIVLLSAVAWSFGAAFARRLPPAGSALLGSGLQLVAGGLGALVFSGLRGEWQHFDPAAVSARSLLAMAYLLFAGSLLAFACFGWLVQIWKPERLSTYAYVNPLVALALGALLAGERIGGRELGATALILGAVCLVMLSNRTQAGEASSPVPATES